MKQDKSAASIPRARQQNLQQEQRQGVAPNLTHSPPAPAFNPLIHMTPPTPSTSTPPTPLPPPSLDCVADHLRPALQRLRSLPPDNRAAVIILGGSFNPVHCGHIAMLHAARDYLASLSPPIATVGKTPNQDPKPQAPNPKPQTPNPKPQTRITPCPQLLYSPSQPTVLLPPLPLSVVVRRYRPDSLPCRQLP